MTPNRCMGFALSFLRQRSSSRTGFARVSEAISHKVPAFHTLEQGRSTSICGVLVTERGTRCCPFGSHWSEGGGVNEFKAP
jgi:hypothetical protein